MNSEELRNEFSRRVSNVLEFARQIPWETQEVYVRWLAQTYYFVRHTPVFLTMIAAKHGAINWEKHVAARNYLREEFNHDQLLLQDLSKFGVAISDVPEFLDTSLFYQAQYYWIGQFGPLAHFGYSGLLEGIAAKGAVEVADRVQAKFGRDCASFLVAHADADQLHFERALSSLDAASPHELVAILSNLRQSHATYLRILQSVAQPPTLPHNGSH